MAANNDLVDKKKTKKLFLVTLIVMIALGVDGQVKKHHEKERQNQEKAKMELRARQFAEYILEDVEKQVDKKMDKQTILWYVDEYKKNPKKYDERIKDLMTDSTKYADAIVRDADVIHEYDKRKGKTLAFEEAMKMVESEQALSVGPKMRGEFRMGVSHGEEVIAGIDYEPTGETEVKGANPRRKLKVNKEHLRETSQMLKKYRTAKDMAK